MRVLLVAHRFPPDSVAGVESYTQRLAAELVKAGDTVSIVARRWAKSPPEPQTVREQLPDGALLYRLAGGEVRLDQFLAHHECLEHLFRAALIEANPDVVHFNHLLGLPPRFIDIAHRLRVAIVVSLHDFYFACPLVHLQKEVSGELCAGPDGGRECARTCFAGEDPDLALRWGLRTMYYRHVLGMADRLISGSRFVASYFEDFARHPAGVRVIPNGVAVEPVDRSLLVCSSPQERGRLNLAYCGTVVRHKGPHVILEALRVADLGAVDLLVIGQTPHPEYVQELRERAATVPGLRLRVYGPFKPAEYPYLLDDVDCVVVPSLVPEAGPQVPREALARGVPVLASRLGALPELLTEGENGFTFDPNRPGDLAAILRRIVQEEGLLGRLREGVLRSHVVTVAEHAEAIRSVYHEAIEDLLCAPTVRAANLAEIGFLHEALLGFGVGDSGTGGEANSAESIHAKTFTLRSGGHKAACTSG